jgi:hypothetical protein
MRTLALLVLGTLLLVSPALAGPRRCGDDVGGRAVPCDCGDLLVSSRTLSDADPITRRVCPGTGLLVDVPANASATLALGGHVLAGSGRGAGIQVVRGGAQGLTVTGPGTVRGFGVGVLAPTGTLAQASEVTASDNRGDGFNMAVDGAGLTGCTARRNGRDGFALRGRRYRLDGNRALENRRYGFALVGRDGAIAGNEAVGNGRDGFRVSGRGHALEAPVATANGADGIRAHVARGRVSGALATGNRGDGLRATGADLDVARNQARDNRGGIDVRGARVRDAGGNRAESCRVGGACR